MLTRYFTPIHFAKALLPSFLAVLVTSCACTDPRKPEANQKNEHQSQEVAALEAPFSTKKASIQKAIAEIKSFKGDQIKGKVTFTKVRDGIEIVADIEGLTPGAHGFHVHEFGDCHDGSTVGSHFNPTHQPHGGPDSPERHVGDLGNLIADDKGHAYYKRVDTLIAFEGKNSILNRSVVIHADPDDFVTQPTGASGDKIACGVIQAVEEKP